MTVWPYFAPSLSNRGGNKHLLSAIKYSFMKPEMLIRWLTCLETRVH